MATKTQSKPKAAPAKAAVPIHGPALAALTLAADRVVKTVTAYNEARESYVKALIDLPTKTPVPQEALFAADMCRRLKGAAEDTYDTFRAWATAHRQAGGSFEHGKVAITFKDDAGRVSPQWKPQALAEAAEAHRLRRWIAEQGLPDAPADFTPKAAFDAAGYEKAVQDASPKTTKTAVSLTVSD